MWNEKKTFGSGMTIKNKISSAENCCWSLQVQYTQYMNRLNISNSYSILKVFWSNKIEFAIPYYMLNRKDNCVTLYNVELSTIITFFRWLH